MRAHPFCTSGPGCSARTRAPVGGSPAQVPDVPAVGGTLGSLGQAEDGPGRVYPADQRRPSPPGGRDLSARGDSGAAYEERCPYRALVGLLLVGEAAMLAEQITVVRDVDDDGVVELAGLPEGGDEVAEPPVVLRALLECAFEVLLALRRRLLGLLGPVGGLVREVRLLGGRVHEPCAVVVVRVCGGRDVGGMRIRRAVHAKPRDSGRGVSDEGFGPRSEVGGVVPG